MSGVSAGEAAETDRGHQSAGAGAVRRCCKHETVVEIGPGGGGLPRVWEEAREESMHGSAARACC